MRRIGLSLTIIATLTACSPVQTPVGNQGAPSPLTSPSGTVDLHGRFVEVPANQPFRYSIVAAGRVHFPGIVGPAYNNLRVVGANPTTGIITLTFDGYAPPDGTFQLIVKALASDENESGGPFVVFLRGFGNDGFELRVTDLNGHRAAPDAVNLMVEVSRYVPAG